MTEPAIVTEVSAAAQPNQNTHQNGFAVYKERRPAGLVGRFVIVISHLLGLVLGGAFAFVRQKKIEGKTTYILAA